MNGVSRAALDALIARAGEGAVPAQQRYDALAQFEELPPRGATKNRYWKHDLTALDLSGVDASGGYDPAANVTGLDALRAKGIVIEALQPASERYPTLVRAALGRAADARDDKFASLAVALQNAGVFIYIPSGLQLDEPIELAYDARETALFPYTLVHAEAGSRATVIKRVRAGGSSFVCGIDELIADDRAQLSFAALQQASASARIFNTCRARAGADASLQLAFADLGGELSTNRIRAGAAHDGAAISTTALFFTDAFQHVDLETEVRHDSGRTTSDTIVRSAATGSGQGRYLGNIKILAHAHGSDASLKDDALLLSAQAHIDSIPALEIAANDVKAFHGATIGAISEDELFYAQSRGIERAQAEKMIALGFFEPATARFPGEALRAEIRAALEAKLA